MNDLNEFAGADPSRFDIAHPYDYLFGGGYLRTRDQIADLFSDWEMVEPGLLDLPEWRPDLLEKRSRAAGLFLSGAARKAKPW